MHGYILQKVLTTSSLTQGWVARAEINLMYFASTYFPRHGEKERAARWSRKYRTLLRCFLSRLLKVNHRRDRLIGSIGFVLVWFSSCMYTQTSLATSLLSFSSKLYPFLLHLFIKTRHCVRHTKKRLRSSHLVSGIGQCTIKSPFFGKDWFVGILKKLHIDLSYCEESICFKCLNFIKYKKCELPRLNVDDYVHVYACAFFICAFICITN